MILEQMQHLFQFDFYAGLVRNQTVTNGTTATFNVAAQGYAPLSYQWRFSGTNLAGATSTNYSMLNAQAANAGNYDVVVNEFCCLCSQSMPQQSTVVV